MGGRSLTRMLALAALLGAGAAPAAHAQASAAERAALRVFEDYRADGRIDPCRHSAEELQMALDNVPPDVEQYASEYPGAIEGAIEARARGDCDEGASQPDAGTAGGPAGAEGTGTPAPAASAPPVPAPATGPSGPTQTVVPDPPSPAAAAPAGSPRDLVLERAVTATASNDAPLPVLLLGLLAVLLALTASAVAVMRRSGLAQERLAPAAHAWREAGWRAGGTWADFRDWLRLGR